MKRYITILFKHHVLPLMLLLTGLHANAQLTAEDSAQIEIYRQITLSDADDSLKVDAYDHWDYLIYPYDGKLDVMLNKKMGRLCEKNLLMPLTVERNAYFRRKLATSHNNRGSYFYMEGDFGNAIVHYTKSLEIAEANNDLNGAAHALNNIASIYAMQGQFDKSFPVQLRSLKIRAMLNTKELIPSAIMNIGYTVQGLGFDDTALVIFRKGLEYAISYEVYSSQVSLLGNIGTYYLNNDFYAEAEPYFLQAIDIAEKYQNGQDIGTTVMNLGVLYLDRMDSVDDGINDSLFAVYAKTSSDYLHEALKMSHDNNSIQRQGCYKYLSALHKKLGDHELALNEYEKYINLSDSLSSSESQREVLNQEYQYYYKKQSAQDSLAFIQQQEISELKHAADLDREQTRRYLLYTGLFCLLVFAFYMYKRIRTTQKQKQLIEIQKTEVELQKTIVDEQRQLVDQRNHEILDSITYAKRIQAAILPPARMVKEHLPQSFVFYQPKDIVAGDFYWMEVSKQEAAAGGSQHDIKKYSEFSDDHVLFAAADCTGHGVPGAMVSVVCTNGLNRSVREFGLTEPGKILDKTREIVISEFEKSEEEVKDGMDISLCSLSLSTLALNWAGANNPLWIVRKDKQALEELKGDKQPIGKFANAKPFTTHSTQLSKGDCIYIFTDGFQDQFGGDKGKKFKASQLKELLVRICTEPMERQHQLIKDAFEKWRDGFEQVDDICVIGVRV